MKVLFTADIHIKIGQKSVPTEWAYNRYKLLIAELTRLQNAVDIVVLGGDIFDKIPSLEELRIYFDLISSFNKPTIIYSGNHEALKKNTTFLTQLKEVSSAVNNNVVVIDYICSLYGIDFLPYNELKGLDFSNFAPTSKILCTHVRGDIPPHVKAEVDLNNFNKWEIVLAGDLHSYENSQRNILYPGSPVTTSFHRNRVKTGVIIFDTETLTHEWVELSLPQMLRKRISKEEDATASDYDLVMYELEGNISELSKIKDNELIDKKISLTKSDSELLLDASMSIEEEVGEYLRYILQLSDEEVVNVLRELGHYVNI